MTITIQQALRPLFIICFIIGLYVYPLNRQKSRVKWVVYLSILYSVTVWFVYGCIWYYMISSLSLAAIFSVIISLIVLAINIITTITSAILNVYYNKRLQICMKKLMVVDDTLKELGTSKIYQKIYTWSCYVIIGWIVWIILLNFNDTLAWLILLRVETASWRFIVAHVYNYSFHANTLEDLIFIVFIWYIGTRFDEINKHMQNLLTKEKCWLRNTCKKPTVIVHQCTLRTDNYKQVLWSSMHLHLELCRIAREWNLMFGTQITFEMASSSLSITSIYYYLYKVLMYEHREEIPMTVWFRIAFWGFMFAGKLYTINYICENVSVKANKIDKIIHELINTPRYADVWKEIYQFSLQTMHHPLKFTGMDLFYFGNEFLIQFCVKTTMCVVIMIQMLNA